MILVDQATAQALVARELDIHKPVDGKTPEALLESKRLLRTAKDYEALNPEPGKYDAMVIMSLAEKLPREKNNAPRNANEDFGRATAGMMEFMGLENDDLVRQGVVSRVRTVTSLKAGELSSKVTRTNLHAAGRKTFYETDADHIRLTPGALIRAYQEKVHEHFIPPILRYGNQEQFVEKGLKFDNLDREALRYGLALQIERKHPGMSVEEVSEGKDVGGSTFRSYLAGRDSKLELVERMRTAIGGTEDIFGLERQGKVVKAYSELVRSGRVRPGSNPEIDLAAKRCRSEALSAGVG